MPLNPGCPGFMSPSGSLQGNPTHYLHSLSTYLAGGLPPGTACPVGGKTREVEWLGNSILSRFNSIHIPEKQY